MDSTLINFDPMGAVTKDHHSKFKQLYQQGLANSFQHSFSFYKPPSVVGSIDDNRCTKKWEKSAAVQQPLSNGSPNGAGPCPD